MPSAGRPTLEIVNQEKGRVQRGEERRGEKGVCALRTRWEWSTQSCTHQGRWTSAGDLRAVLRAQHTEGSAYHSESQTSRVEVGHRVSRTEYRSDWRTATVPQWMGLFVCFAYHGSISKTQEITD